MMAFVSKNTEEINDPLQMIRVCLFPGFDLRGNLIENPQH
jgi:hypothetical protein